MSKDKVVTILVIVMTYAFLVSFPYLGLCLSLQDTNVWISFKAGMIGIAHLAASIALFRVYVKLEES